MTTPSLAATGSAATETGRTGLSRDALRRALFDNLYCVQGKFPALATQHDYYMALAYTVRDRMLQRWISTAAAYTRQGARTVAYFSAEFLLGPHLANNLINLGIEEPVKQAIRQLGLSYEQLIAQDEEPGLGNGGLGRLAACYLDSMATLEIASIGYGIRYEFGIFAQRLVDGWQVEQTDKWLLRGNPWELPRPEWAVQVKRPHRDLCRHPQPRPGALGGGPHGAGHSLRHANPRLPQQHCEHAAPVAGRGA